MPAGGLPLRRVAPISQTQDTFRNTRESLIERRSHLRPLAPLPQPQSTLPPSVAIPNANLRPAPAPSDVRTEPRTQRVLLPAGPLPVPTLQQSLPTQPSLLDIRKRRDSALLRPAVKKQRTLGPRKFQDNLNRALSFLHDELETRAIASDAFPPEISSSHIRASVARYEDVISEAAKRCVCSSCGNLYPALMSTGWILGIRYSCH